jgi:hypothetical protein
MERIANMVRKGFRSFRDRLQSQGVTQTIRWAGMRLFRFVWARDEVLFYELTNRTPAFPKSDGMFLKAIDFETLAIAAMQNAEDDATLDYLLRCAKRLRTEAVSIGYALTNPVGDLLHFTWAGPFEKFYWAELDSNLPSPAPNSIVLFDSWTPTSQRGRGYSAPTLGLVIAKIREEGKRCWGFSASTNGSSVRGFDQAGFRRCFSVFRYRFLWWQRIVQKNTAMTSGSQE